MPDNVTPLSPKANRHPVDRYGELQEQLKKMEAEKADLRDWILAHPAKREGEDYKASVASPFRDVYDLAAIKKYFGLKALERFCRRQKITFVQVTRKK